MELVKHITLVALAVVASPSLALEWPAKNISELPAHIKAPDSGLALIADFDHARTGGIPLYLINRTGKDVSFSAQDGDFFLKLEYQDKTGAWKRAEPHLYAPCGESYSSITVRSDSFIMFGGYQPAGGETATIRFRFYQGNPDLASNPGRGLISQADVKRAAIDSMAVESGDFETLSAIATKPWPYPKLKMTGNDARMMAIHSLGSGDFDLAAARKVLRKIANSKDEPYADIARQKLKILDYATKAAKLRSK